MFAYFAEMTLSNKLLEILYLLMGLVALNTGLKNLRDVVPFPKVQNASELMSNCPSEVSPEQLKELGIAIVAQPEN